MNPYQVRLLDEGPAAVFVCGHRSPRAVAEKLEAHARCRDDVAGTAGRAEPLHLALGGSDHGVAKVSKPGPELWRDVEGERCHAS